ncbi:hypothetical protein SAMN05216178_0771 [Pseudomonas saponiphila]|uniref:Uncharacterized protein n=1 Tax=Pseudomonas saponiphila TaxID=556534 RepID=A0A1H4JVL1_9PSED|nr:hypothetical protein SAMN05216178_0771 [Pseudomonas saponiphila]
MAVGRGNANLGWRMLRMNKVRIIRRHDSYPIPPFR